MAGDLGEEERKSACKCGFVIFKLEDPLHSFVPSNFADDSDGWKTFFGVPGYTPAGLSNTRTAHSRPDLRTLIHPTGTPTTGVYDGSIICVQMANMERLSNSDCLSCDEDILLHYCINRKALLPPILLLRRLLLLPRQVLAYNLFPRPCLLPFPMFILPPPILLL